MQAEIDGIGVASGGHSQRPADIDLKAGYFAGVRVEEAEPKYFLIDGADQLAARLHRSQGRAGRSGDVILCADKDGSSSDRQQEQQSYSHRSLQSVDVL
ncbi:MAG: hypothetical protein K8J31_17535 [Anaerolineae bacterium]|nr:hypothetical protein [Anaerolineae bacterium]